MRILIVDDSETSTLLLRTILTKSGYTDLATATSAAEAQDYLLDHARAGRKQADLVLMDVSMPEMDGIEATTWIKSQPRLADIPVVMVTARDDENVLEAAFQAGAVDYIQKPVSKVELRARVRSVLRFKQEMDTRKKREAELERMADRLTELSNLDGLTGTSNRRAFDMAMAREFRRAQRSASPLGILLIDIDYFKPYNDTYGHLDGDECLKRVARIIRSTLKRPGDMLARFGGEEFVVILPDTGLAGAEALARDIRKNVEAAKVPHGSSPTAEVVTVSVGVAAQVPPPHVEGMAEADPLRLIDKADRALYAAKHGGRNQVVVFAD